MKKLTAICAIFWTISAFLNLISLLEFSQYGMSQYYKDEPFAALDYLFSIPLQLITALFFIMLWSKQEDRTNQKEKSLTEEKESLVDYKKPTS